MKIGIVGAGVTGLTAAWRLAKQGHRVVVMEKSVDIGGLVAGACLGEEPLERIYHHIFTSDSHVITLAGELGLLERLVWRTPKSGLYIRNRLYPFSSPFHLLTFPELPLMQRIRLGLLVLRARFIRNWKVMENIRAKDWLIRFAGKQTYEVLWAPLIRSKFDKDADDISAVWIWNKFKLRGATRGANASSEAFGYLQGGFTQLYETLAAQIHSMSGEVRLGEEVCGISRTSAGRLSVRSSKGEDAYDAVLFTGAPVQLLQLVTFSDAPTYAERCAQLRYKANLCLMLLLTKSLSPFYWTTVADASIPFVLAIEHTRLMQDRPYGGTVLYLSRYLDEKDPLFDKSEEEITTLFLDGLKRMYPAFTHEMVRGTILTRERYAQPVVGLQYASRLPAMMTPIPGLYLASMAQIYPEDRGQNYAIRMGEEAAALMNRQESKTTP